MTTVTPLQTVNSAEPPSAAPPTPAAAALATPPPQTEKADAADMALLQRFAPVIRYTRGERFFPAAVDCYVANCSLWQQTGEDEAIELVPETHLTLERLAQLPPAPPGTVYFLKFIEPLNITELANYAVSTGLSQKDPNKIFKAGQGRLARVGYGSRFADALFSLTLLARGRVPGDTAAAAMIAYEKMQHEQERYQYYGRVVRRGDWVALQYWFFYAFNNWRSGFFGVNDHEADWEMVYVYLAEQPNGDLQPEWVAYASHDFSGDDLRRHWHDPEVEKVGEHPVIYAGAGSHASYFHRGEYLAEIELPFLSPLVKLVDKGQALVRKWTRPRQNRDEVEVNSSTFNMFRIPFVDYARGDGLEIGAGGDKEWAEPILLNETQMWALKYRGLWGLFARDPIAGENAPAGPVYNRDGSVRQSWFDPLGWAGMDKVSPFAKLPAKLRERQAELQAEHQQRAKLIGERSHTLLDLGVDTAVMQGQLHLQRTATHVQDKVNKIARELTQLHAQQTETEALLEATAARLAQVEAGEYGALRAHIRRAHLADENDIKFNRWAEWWAAVSIGLMTMGFVTLLALVLANVLSRGALLWGLLGLVTVIVFVEASFRRQLHRLIPTMTIMLAVVAAAILIYEFFGPLVILSVLLAGSYLVWENVREMASR